MVRLFHRADGGVAVMRFVDESNEQLKARDTDAFLVANPGSTWEDIEETAVPSSRRFRNSWTKGEKRAEVHMPRARAQVLGEVRAKRNAALAASDGVMLRAQETGQPTQELAAKRQALRDLPAVVAPQLEALTTPEELEAFSVEV